VKKGQFLISLENMEYIQLQQDYLQARDELEYLKAVYERKKILAGEQITSLSSKQEAESDYNTALASYKGLRKMLQMVNISPDKLQAENISSTINLYAPINGYLAKVNAVEGVFAEQTDVIFEIINTDQLHLELKVYEKDILKVRKGQKISFKLPEANSENYSGEVFLVGKTIDGADKTVLVYCHIGEKYNLPLIVGMYIEAKIQYATREEYCLPTDAFIREEGDYFVFIEKSATDDEYVFEKVKVNVGHVNEDCVEIVEDSFELLEGKQVLIQGAFDL
jgi:cobalt-zinc-cadmium efflux system membrane fusion protein